MNDVADDYWKSEDYASHASYVSRLSHEVMQDLAPQRGEQILDLGCGDGELAEVLMRLGCDVVGIDSSAGLIEAAKRRGVKARLDDAQAIEYDAAFDAIFSNAALHWMLAQAALSRRVFRALKPNGRFVCTRLVRHIQPRDSERSRPRSSRGDYRQDGRIVPPGALRCGRQMDSGLRAVEFRGREIGIREIY